jgi:hypothetical protein
MKYDKIWEELRRQLGNSDGTIRLGVETLAEEGKHQLPVRICDCRGRCILSTLVFDTRVGLLTWRATLLASPKKSKKMRKSLEKSAGDCLDFFAMTRLLHLARLELSEECGPVLCLGHYLSELSDELFADILREMQCALPISTRLTEYLEGEAELELTPFEIGWRVGPFLDHADPPPHGEKSDARKSGQGKRGPSTEEIPERVTAISEALNRGDWQRARDLATGGDEMPIPEQI